MNVRQRGIRTMSAVLMAGATLLLDPAGAAGPGGGGPRAGAGGGPWPGNGASTQGGGGMRPGGNGPAQGGHGSDRLGGGTWNAAVPANVAVVADLPGPYWCGCYTCSEFPPPMPASGPGIVAALPSAAMPDIGAPEAAGSEPAAPAVLRAPPAAPEQSPPAVIDVWYWCAQPAGYYPYVQSCNLPWQPVRSGSAPAAAAASR
jgi:hypothetical protein